ncbi:MAG: hypothetical protein IKO91_08220 [Oscillospiraceae bacterium]|nr:hypothetical protein [Oscillospiraceae bacterium]
MRSDPAGKLLTYLPVLAAFLLLTLRPGSASEAAAAGLETCLRAVIPALFPFLVLTSAILRLGIPKRVERFLGAPFERLFRIRRSALPVFLLGLAGGYPVGAAAAAESFRRGACSREEAERLVIFSNNCSPGFLLGLAGGQILGNRRAALFLLFLQWMVSVYMGWLLGFGCAPSKRNDDLRESPAPSPAELLTGSVRDGGRTCLLICAYVVFFSVLASFLPALPLLRGMLEMTGGLLLLGGDTLPKLMQAAFLLGFGGLSIACQAAAAAQAGGLHSGRYLPLRLLHGLCMAFCTWCFLSGPGWIPVPFIFGAAVPFLMKRGGKKEKSVV